MMAVLKKILIQGAEYTLVKAASFNDDAQQYVVTVKRANGDLARAFSTNEKGPFSFKAHLDGAYEEPEPHGKMKVTIIRHGSTELNKEDGNGPDRIRGWKDLPLSTKGQTECAALAGKLKNSGITVIYHSDLIRATQTAEAIAKTTEAKLIAVHDMRPWNVGVFTGQESKTAVPEIKAYAMDKPDEPLEGGESWSQFKTRVFTALRTLLVLSEGQEVGIVTHHRVERLVKAWIANGQLPDGSVNFATMFSIGEKPATAEKIELDIDKLIAVEV